MQAEQYPATYREEQLAKVDKMTAQSYHEEESREDFYTKNIAPNTKAFLRHMAKKAVAVQFVPFYGNGRQEEFERIFGGEEGKAYKEDNTYNHNEPWTDSMCVATPIMKNEEAAYSLAFARHLGGDVRANYEDFIVLTFNNFWDATEAVDEFLQENAYSFECDGRKFECRYLGGGEHFMLTEIGGDFQSDAFLPEPWDEAEFLDSVHKVLDAE